MQDRPDRFYLRQITPGKHHRARRDLDSGDRTARQRTAHEADGSGLADAVGDVAAAPPEQGGILEPRQRSSDPVHAAASVSARLTAVAIRSRRYSGEPWMSPIGLTDAHASRAMVSISSGEAGRPTIAPSSLCRRIARSETPPTPSRASLTTLPSILSAASAMPSAKSPARRENS